MEAGATNRGKAGVLDWEYGALKGFPYLDLAYHILQTSLLIYLSTPARAVDHVGRYLSAKPWPALSSSEARALTCLAAHDAYLKAQEDGRPPDGRRQRWLRMVWEEGG